MADNHRSLDTELPERLAEQLGLLRGGPHAPARALAVSEAGSVEDDDRVPVQQEVG